MATLLCRALYRCQVSQTSAVSVLNPLPIASIPIRGRKRWVRAMPKNTKRPHWHFLSDEEKRKETWNITLERLNDLMRQPPKQSYLDRQICISCTGDIYEPYVPPEGDGKASSLSKEGIKQRAERLKNVGISTKDLRKIRKHEPEFSTKDFAFEAQDIFIKAHDALQNFDKNILHQLVTEKCYPDMIRGFRYKTIRWKWIESIEKPKVVYLRCADMVTQGNTYAQVTVRFHSKQTLAIYDRFGRLMQGSETSPKDVLEYVVFERHLAGAYGSWRIHGKIVPAWATHRQPMVKTMIEPEQEIIVEEEEPELPSANPSVDQSTTATA
ncbi:large ribosomal subunit protein mL45-like [Ptychodera flava]|uniref:large ribosomal subunit protein mL45-like n=1 Tax=Ptychodera flava TaxID=63121 RepID=UPI00396A9914